MFAVIKTGGKQYKVAANDVLKIEKLDGEAGDAVTFAEVLMVGTGADVTVGAPLVEGAIVAAELVETRKSKTIIVFKKKRRHNYRRRNGHRQLLSTVRITEILLGGSQPSARAAASADQAAEQPARQSPAAPAPSEQSSPESIEAQLPKVAGAGKAAVVADAVVEPTPAATKQ